MNANVLKSKVQIVKDYLALESTMVKPVDDVVKKITNLSGLLETSNIISNGWRGSEKKPNLQIPLRFNGSRSESFQSLPNLSTSPATRISKNTSFESLPSRTPIKYVSKYKNNETQVEEKILNTIILSKLNKFSLSTYDDIRDFLFQILGTQESFQTQQEKTHIEDFIKEFMVLVFKKAASEEIFCPLYAKLLSEISEKYPIILDEMDKLHQNYLHIFDECDETSTSNYEEFIQKNREKKYRQGYSQFLAELTLVKILSIDKLITIYDKIFTQILKNGKVENKIALIEQYIDCLLRITKVLKNKNDEFYIKIKIQLQNIVKLPYDEMMNNKDIYISISQKSRFLLMDIQDYLKT